jgi:hypothetical protein
MYCHLSTLQDHALTERGESPANTDWTAACAGFWEGIVSSRDLQRRVPLERWDWEPLYSPAITPGKQHNTFVDHADIEM